MHRSIRKFCNQVDAIIAPSTSIKNYLLLQNITTPITVIPSPLRNIFTHHIHHIIQKNDNHFFELLLVTRCTPEKNIPFVFDVIQLLPLHFRLTIVGYGSEYEKLQALAFDRLCISKERIQFIHKPSETDLLSIYQTSHLFIFPSQTDTQAIVLAESMSQGVPVIALDGPGQRDIIIDGINGFITTDAKKTAKIILKISADKKLYDYLVSGAQSTARNYRSPIIIQKLLTLYDSVNNNCL